MLSTGSVIGIYLSESTLAAVVIIAVTILYATNLA